MKQRSWNSEECTARQEGDCIRFGNRHVERVISIADGEIRTEALINRRTGRNWRISAPHEAKFTFATGAPRIEIPFWRYRPGTPEAVEPDRDRGFLEGRAAPDFDDSGWRTVDCPTAVGESWREDTESVWPGFGWFRASFDLPEVPPEALDETVWINLGGWDGEDWEYYRVFLNGVEVGSRELAGRWREPRPFQVLPGERAHGALRCSEPNLLAVQAGRLDKRPPSMVPGELEHYKFGSRMVDQFITLGEPTFAVYRFKVSRWVFGGDRDLGWLRIFADNPEARLSCVFHYQIRTGEPLMRKKVSVRNTGSAPRFLLDVDVESWELNGETSDGGYGLPILVDDQAFCALEHPAGLNRGLGAALSLRHFPGAVLHPRQAFLSKTALFGVTEERSGIEGFRRYIKDNGRRRDEWVAIYDPLGLVDTCHGWEPRHHLTEQIALDTVEMLKELQEKGIRFDSYIIDHGWQDHASDLTRFRKDEFPDGPAKLIKAVERAGMDFGLWFSATYGLWSCGDYAPVQSCVVPRIGGAYDLCPAAEPYQGVLRAAMLYHIRNSAVKAVKIDMARFWCCSTEHGHLPGKYSVEAQIDSFVDIARDLLREREDLFIIWYWGFNSPFWLLYGSTLFDKGLLMEAAAVASSPNPRYRSATSHNLDQAVRHARFVPLAAQDSLGIWIGDVTWCNRMGKEDWREAWLLDLGRGSMTIQLWGDLTLFNDEDVSFLAEWFAFVRRNGSLYARTKPILGDPWKTEAYGYAAGDGAHAIVTIHNPAIRKAEITLILDQSIGLDAGNGSDVEIRRLYRDKAVIRRAGRRTFRIGGELSLALRPFEVTVIEIGGSPTGGQWRVEDETDVPDSIPLTMSVAPAETGAAASPRPRRSRTDGYQEKRFQAQTRLPEIREGDSAAFVIRLSLRGEHWYHQEICELFSLKAAVEGKDRELRKTPKHFTLNGPGSPWLLLDIDVGGEDGGKTLELDGASLLPPEVEWKVEGWLYERWWERPPSV